MSQRTRNFRRILLAVLGIAFIALFLPFHREILLAVFFAFALDPLTRRLSVHKYLRRRGWVAVTLLGLFLTIALPFGLATYNVYRSIGSRDGDGSAGSKTLNELRRMKEVVVTQANRALRSLRLDGEINSRQVDEAIFGKLGPKTVAISGRIASSIPELVLSLFVFTCALYFFLAESRKVKELARGARLLPESELDQLIQVVARSCASILIASVIIGALQASIVAIGAAAFRAGDFFVVFVVTFFFSFIPVIGAAPVGMALALFALLQQEYGNAVGLAGVALVAGTVDNIVRPLLVGSEEQVHPVVVLVAIIGGIAVFGLAGLFLGPLIASVTIRVYARYFYNDRQALALESAKPKALPEKPKGKMTA